MNKYFYKSKKIKIASEDLINYKLLKKFQKQKKNNLSTVMADDEIKAALRLFKNKKITLLHCVSLYPTENKLANLMKLRVYKKI